MRPTLPTLACRLIAKRPSRHGSQRERWYLYDVMLDSKIVVSDSHDPECELARALLSRGITGIAEVIDDETGRTRSRVNIEAAARITARDDPVVRFLRWQKFEPQRVRGPARTGESTSGDGPPPEPTTRAPLREREST